MKVNKSRVLLIGYFVLFLAGCNHVIPASTPQALPALTNEATIMPETQPTSTAPRQEDDMPRDPPLSIPKVQGFPSLIETAKSDLARRLSSSASQVNTVEVEEVTWPDDSLGCPQPGKTYAQEPIPGYRILFESNGKTFEYHTDLRDSVLYCENPTRPLQETPANSLP